MISTLLLPIKNEARFADPLTSVTRAERRWLLISSIIVLAVTYGGLVPQKIAALGIELSPGASQSLVVLFIAVQLYFLITFYVYSRTDLVVWRRELSTARDEPRAEMNRASADGANEVFREEDEQEGRMKRTLAALGREPEAVPASNDETEKLLDFVFDPPVRWKLLGWAYEFFLIDERKHGLNLPEYYRFRWYGIRAFLDVRAPLIMGSIVFVLALLKVLS